MKRNYKLARYFLPNILKIWICGVKTDMNKDGISLLPDQFNLMQQDTK
jgi:hypothetical protein